MSAESRNWAGSWSDFSLRLCIGRERIARKGVHAKSWTKSCAEENRTLPQNCDLFARFATIQISTCRQLYILSARKNCTTFLRRPKKFWYSPGPAFPRNRACRLFVETVTHPFGKECRSK